jgi:hypothetical protein
LFDGGEAFGSAQGRVHIKFLPKRARVVRKHGRVVVYAEKGRFDVPPLAHKTGLRKEKLCWQSLVRWSFQTEAARAKLASLAFPVHLHLSRAKHQEPALGF